MTIISKADRNVKTVNRIWKLEKMILELQGFRESGKHDPTLFFAIEKLRELKSKYEGVT